MIVMLDNYDSFTFNIVQYLAELGADLKVFRNDEVSVEQVLELRPTALVLSPGPGRPERAGIMNDLVRTAVGRLPILGVCLGHQAIAQVFGGEIDYAPQLMHGKTSEIHHDGSELYAGIPDPFTATRYHSLVVSRDRLPEELVVTSWTDDGVIMGLRHRQWPVFGVQFHPESIMTPHGKRLLANFLELAA